MLKLVNAVLAIGAALLIASPSLSLVQLSGLTEGGPVGPGDTILVGDLILGQQGAMLGVGSLLVSNGNTLSADAMILGLEGAPSEGEAVVQGPGSRVVLSDTLQIGSWGEGRFTVSNGGIVDISNGDLAVTNAAGSTGALSISGLGSQVNVLAGRTLIGAAAVFPGFGDIGGTSTAIVDVLGGAQLNTSYNVDSFVGLAPAGTTSTGAESASGVVTIDGAGSEWNVVQIGGAGGATGIGRGSGASGTVNVTGGGRFALSAVGTALVIGDGGTGSVSVDGPGSVLQADTQIVIGGSTFLNPSPGAGSGTLSVTNGGVVDAGLYDLAQGGSASVTIDNGRLIARDGGAAALGVPVLRIGESGAGTASVTASNGSAIELIGSGQRLFAEVGRSAEGSLILDGGSSLTFDGANNLLNVGVFTKGTLEVKGGSSVDVAAGSSTGAEVEVGFGSGSDGLISVSGNSSFNAGDTLFISNRGIAGSSGRVEVFDTSTISAALTTVGVGGTLAGTGTVIGNVLLNGGVVAPGLSPGKLTINGDLQVDSGSILIEIEGTGTNEFDVVDATGTVSVLGGTVVLAFGGGFAPQQGDSFEFLLGSSVLVDPSVSFNLTGLEAGFQFVVGSLAGGFGMTALNDGVPLPEAGLGIQMILGAAGLASRNSRRRRTGKLAVESQHIR